MSDEAVFNLLCWSLAIVCFLGGFVFGMDYAHWKRLRWDKSQADRMREGIREYDDRVAEFAAPILDVAQSSSLGEKMAGARTTAFAPLPPSHRACPRGAEACLCDKCVSRGIPPSP